MAVLSATKWSNRSNLTLIGKKLTIFLKTTSGGLITLPLGSFSDSNFLIAVAIFDVETLSDTRFGYDVWIKRLNWDICIL
jgi:hypothetical protein